MNIHSLPIHDFLAAQGLTLDVRSPGEYQLGHIPGAINLPLFSDKQREIVGTVYTQTGRVPAIQQGFEFVGQEIKRLTDALQAAHPAAAESGSASPDPSPTKLKIHCWRGGMRSQSLAWLAGMLQIPAITLEGGYKSYRRLALECFQFPWKLITLSGLTGAGKTVLLQRLAKAGEQIVDLEGLANHRGSAFGSIGLPPQPANQHFENLLFESLRNLDPTRRVWVEDEARAIGKVRVPQDFWETMRQAPVLFVDVPLEFRIRNLLEVYGGYPSAALAESIQQIHKRFGPQKTEATMDALDHGDLERVTRLTLEYYDQAYSRSASRRTRKNVFRIEPADSGHDLFVQLTQSLIDAASQMDTISFETMSDVLQKLEKSVAAR